MKALLKWLYGYKNFGDEMLFLWLIDRIWQNYDIKKLCVEVGDKERIDRWLVENKEFIGHMFDKLDTFEISQNRWKKLTHIMTILGLNPYKKYFKFFWWWEVLNQERPFPHDWRNIPILYNRTVRHKNFVLLGWVWKDTKLRTRMLYKYLLPKAQKTVTREKFSYQHALKYSYKVEQFQDFSLSVLNAAKKKLESQEHSVFHSLKEKLTQLFGHKEQQKYVLININSYIYNQDSIDKIKKFCDKYSNCKKIYFPCDMEDDLKYFDLLQEEIEDLVMFDWTEHTLLETLKLFWDCEAGLWARLHFLYPLKVFSKPLEPLVYKDKVRKLILED